MRLKVPHLSRFFLTRQVSNAAFTSVLVSALLAVAALAVSPVAHAQQMFMSGNFAVTPSGSASYSIPIDPAPGIAGMQPSLALEYNSQSGNGLMGIGWNIGGMSMITRCGTTLAQDGVKGTVNYDSNDRLCLDGQRLVLVSGTYGTAGSEYRTEIDGQLKVVAYGNQSGLNKAGWLGGSPQYFKVWSKDLLIAEYGSTEDSRIEAQSTNVPILWLKNRVQDRKNNCLTWTYTENNATGEWYPTQVKYTGNATTGLVPQNTIQFVYEPRSDIQTGWHAGSASKVIQRLSKVQVLQGTANTNLREYRVAYDLAAGAGPSRATSIQQCVGSVCLAPAKFTLGETPLDWKKAWLQSATATAVGSLWKPTQAVTIPGDFNADGVTDLLQIRTDSDEAQVLQGQRNGGFSRVFYQAKDTTKLIWGMLNADTYPMDLNGDGKTDLLQIGRNNGNAQTLISKGDGTFTKVFQQTANVPAVFNTISPSPVNIPLDINGDGRVDLVQIGGVALSDGTGRFSKVTGPSIIGVADNRDWPVFQSTLSFVGGQWLDFNGDGKVDYIEIMPSVPSGDNYGGHASRLLMYNGANFVTVGELPGSAVYTGDAYLKIPFSQTENLWQTIPVDINGDGKTDLVQLRRAYIADDFSDSYVYLSTYLSDGNGFPSVYSLSQSLGQVTPTLFWLASTCSTLTLDFNEDGKTDFLQVRGDGDAQILASNGDGTFTKVWSQTPTTATDSNRIWQKQTQTLQIEIGTGKPALLQIRDDGAAQILTLADSPRNQIVAINMAGASTNIAYGLLTDPAVYTKGTGITETWPRVDLQPALSVVRQVQVSNGVGGFRTSSYRYGGLKAEQNTGRGSLGFAWQETTDVDTNVTVRTENLQTWPFVGMPGKVTRKLGNQLLGQTTSSYGYASYSGNTKDTTPIVAANKRYRIFSNSNLESTWDLNGAFIGSARTTMSNLDEYNNPGQIIIEQLNAAGNPLGYSTTTVSTYLNDANTWMLGRLQRSTVTKTVPNTIPAAALGTAPNAGKISGP